MNKLVETIENPRDVYLAETMHVGSISNDFKTVSFADETKKAMQIIDSFSEVEESYRETLKSLIEEANTAIQKSDTDAQAITKSKFKGFLLGAGRIVSNILTKLSELATISSFFGLGK